MQGDGQGFRRQKLRSFKKTLSKSVRIALETFVWPKRAIHTMIPDY